MRALFLSIITSIILPISAFGAPATEDEGRVVATYSGNGSITVGRVNQEIKRLPILGYQMSLAKGDEAKIAEVKKVAINAIIERALLVRAAIKENVLDDKSANEQVAAFITQNYGSDEKLAPMLKGIGTELPDFKAEVANDFRIRSYLEKLVPSSTTPTDEELHTLFDKDKSRYGEPEGVRARHILKKLDPKASDADVKKVQAEMKKIHSDLTKPGADFGEIAKKVSECPSAPKGGDLGFFGRGMMVPEFENAAFALKPGEISEPLRTQFGYHIIKLEEHRAEKLPTFEEAKPRLIEDMIKFKRAQAARAKLDELKKDANIEVKL